MTTSSNIVNQIPVNAGCGFKMEKPKMPKFSGDVREYAIFRTDFKHAIASKYSKREAIFLPTSRLGRDAAPILTAIVL